MTKRTIVIGLLLTVFSSLIIIESCTTPDEDQSLSSTSWKIPDAPPGNADDAEFFNMAWELFIALNWPANNSKSQPDTNAKIPQTENSYTTVWESFTNTFDLYTRGPGNPNPIPENCCKEADDNVKQHTQSSKVGIANEFIQAAMDSKDRAPLIDLNSKYVRYEVVYNPTMAKYVADNQTYNKEGLAKFKENHTGLDFTNGSMVVKAAWKVMGANDNAKDFFTTQSCMIYIQDKIKGYDPHPDTSYCSLDEVGLVGMHIAWKAEGHPNWIWMTFEHKDNAPDLSPSPPKEGKYSFYNPDRLCKTPVDCINQVPDVPDGYKNYTPQAPNQTPAQIERIIPVWPGVVDANTNFHTNPLVKNTIWENYNLIGVQWSDVESINITSSDIKPHPTLANTSIETWEQTRASCMGCHNITAKAAYLDGLKTDYVWSAFKALNQDPTENQKSSEKKK